MATPGKSAPEALVGQLVERPKAGGAASVEQSTGGPKQVSFGLPTSRAEAPSYPQGV
jgi:hypothetical protein